MQERIFFFQKTKKAIRLIGFFYLFHIFAFTTFVSRTSRFNKDTSRYGKFKIWAPCADWECLCADQNVSLKDVTRI